MKAKQLYHTTGFLFLFLALLPVQRLAAGQSPVGALSLIHI